MKNKELLVGRDIYLRKAELHAQVVKVEDDLDLVYYQIKISISMENVYAVVFTTATKETEALSSLLELISIISFALNVSNDFTSLVSMLQEYEKEEFGREIHLDIEF